MFVTNYNFLNFYFFAAFKTVLTHADVISFSEIVYVACSNGRLADRSFQ